MRWKKFCIPAVILLLTACTREAKISIIPKDYENDYSTVHMQILAVDIPDAPEFSKSLNAALMQEAEDAAAGFDADAGTATGTNGEKSIFDTTQTIHYNKNNFISTVEEQYTYTGGAHGMTMRKSHNIDTLAQQEITLRDLFSEEGYESTLNRMIREVREKHPENYSDLWEEPIIKPSHQQDFYLTDTDLVIYYQPYALSYYARGFVEFPLRLTELRGYLKEEYYRLVPE